MEAEQDDVFDEPGGRKALRGSVRLPLYDVFDEPGGRKALGRSVVPPPTTMATSSKTNIPILQLLNLILSMVTLLVVVKYR